MLFDLPLEQLREYRPARDEPADFEAFWSQTLAEARGHPLAARFEPVDVALTTLDSYDVSFAGYGGQQVRGWLLLPRPRSGRLPCVMEYIGYGAGRGHPLEWLIWASVGFAHLIMDTRAQGSTWRPGDTPDLVDGGSDPAFPGYMTRGIADPGSYYYPRVYTDAVRAVEAARSHPEIDPAHVAMTGVSQGGGIVIAVAGLVADLKPACRTCHSCATSVAGPRSPTRRRVQRSCVFCGCTATKLIAYSARSALSMAGSSPPAHSVGRCSRSP